MPGVGVHHDDCCESFGLMFDTMSCLGAWTAGLEPGGPCASAAVAARVHDRQVQLTPGLHLPDVGGIGGCEGAC